jgi:xanthine dehydrogenase accessory factor
VGQAVAAQAHLVGFDLVVIDDRAPFTRPEHFPPGTTLRCGTIHDKVAAEHLDEDTYVVIVTRGHKHDADALAACIRQPAAYIGMIGSRRKVRMMREDFIGSGRATAVEFDRVYAPIGLDIGSVTVAEIAASIVAQLIAVRRRGKSPRFSGT